MSIYLYDTIDISKIRFSSKPYKSEIKDGNNGTKSVYFIDINYYKNPLYIQLPKLSVIKVENSKIWIKINDNVYQRLIKLIEECIIDKVYNNSKKWFNGKRFTMNKIMNSLITPIQYKNGDYILEMIYDKNTSFYNQYKSQVTLLANASSGKSTLRELLPIDSVCIIKLEGLQFVDNKFTYNIFLEQAKIFQPVRLKEYSILENLRKDLSSIHLDNQIKQTQTHLSKTKASDQASVQQSDLLRSRASAQQSDSISTLSSSFSSILDDEYYLEKK